MKEEAKGKGERSRVAAHLEDGNAVLFRFVFDFHSKELEGSGHLCCVLRAKRSFNEHLLKLHAISEAERDVSVQCEENKMKRVKGTFHCHNPFAVERGPWARECFGVH